MKISKKLFSLLIASVLSFSALQTETNSILSTVNAKEVEQEQIFDSGDSPQDEITEDFFTINDWELPTLNEIEDYLDSDAIAITETLETVVGSEYDPMDLIYYNSNAVTVQVIESDVNWNVPGTYKITYRVDIYDSTISYKISTNVVIYSKIDDSTSVPEQDEENESDEGNIYPPDVILEEENVDYEEEPLTSFSLFKNAQFSNLVKSTQSSNAHITRKEQYYYYTHGMGDNDGWSTFQYYINGDPAYCIEAQKTGTGNGHGTIETVNNETLLKTFYYGYRGPGHSNGIDTIGDSKLTTVQKFIVTHCAATNAYRTVYVNSEGNVVNKNTPGAIRNGYYRLNENGKKLVKEFEKLVETKETPTSEISLSQNKVTASLDGDSKVLKTEVIYLNAFSDNEVTVKLPENITMLDETGKKVIGTSGSTASLKGTNGFILSKTITDSKESHKLTFNGSFKHDYANHVVKFSGNTQDFGRLSAVETGPGTAVLNVEWPTELTQITIIKKWNDANNQDGKRPRSINVNIYRSDDQNKVYQSVTLDADHDWRLTVENLPKYNNKGKEVTYSIKEAKDESLSEYSSNIDGTTITNTYKPEVISINGSKTWADNDDEKSQRPDHITVRLYKKDSTGKNIEVTSKRVTQNEDWKYSFTNLAKYEAGKEIEYSVTEDPIIDYETTYSGDYKQQITNKYAPQKTSISIAKVWNDADNQDGIRPNLIKVQLTKNGKPVENAIIELSEANGWKASFDDLNKFDRGQPISWNIKELDIIKGYESDISPKTDNASEYIITNTHKPAVTRVAGEKFWEDNNNQDGKRPEFVEIELFADGKTTGKKTTATVTSGWKYSFEDLPKFEKGNQIVYTIREKKVEGYTFDINRFEITNFYTPEKTSIGVTKIWEDDNDRDGIRPEFITVVLMKDGKETDQKLTLSSNNRWSSQFRNLDKYEENGNPIRYSIKELEVKGYTSTITGSAEDGFYITNSHTILRNNIEGFKVWDDESMQGKRPTSINIHLFSNGQKIDTKAVTPDVNGEWKYSFSALPVYEAGKKIEYSVIEEHVGDYTARIDGLNIRNSYTPGKRSISVVKVWNDVNDQDGKRPLEIEVELLKNGIQTGTKAILNEANNWTVSFEGLDDYDLGENAAKVENIYTVTETSEVDGYTTTIEGDMNSGFQIVNSHAPETTEIHVNKEWDDNNNQDGKRPESINLILEADGELIDEVVVQSNENGNWEHTFDNLPKYRDHGIKIEYRIIEKEIDGYSVSYRGENFDNDSNIIITNAYTPEKTSIPISKTWLDADNQDGIRPDSIEVLLLANGKKTDKALVLNAANNWTDSFADLDRYENGDEIEYTVEEVSVAGYETEIAAREDGGFDIINTHLPEMIAINGSKTWDDNDNQDGIRPDSIEVSLRADGEIVETVVVTVQTEWKWAFENLPKFKDGQLIEYTITEGSIENYSMKIDGYDLTNTHTPGKTSLAVSKVWIDRNDNDNVRPNEVVIELLANGTPTGKKVTLNKTNKWQAVFNDLDIYKDQKKIEYTVQEAKVDGYSSVVTGNMEEGFTVTNTRASETITINGSKIWNDNDNRAGDRPSRIRVNLRADGVIVKTAIVTANNGWEWTFRDLPKFKDGKEIVYTITEGSVENYTARVDGYDLINTHISGKTSIAVSKVWVDENDRDGIRPNSVIIELLADGKATGKRMTLSNSNRWQAMFSDLDIYEGQKKIEYTVREVTVNGYTSAVTGNMEDGFTVTNTHTVRRVTVPSTNTTTTTGGNTSNGLNLPDTQGSTKVTRPSTSTSTDQGLNLPDTGSTKIVRASANTAVNTGAWTWIGLALAALILLISMIVIRKKSSTN